MDENTNQAIELLMRMHRDLADNPPKQAIDLIRSCAIFAPATAQDQYIAWSEALDKLQNAEMHLREGVLGAKEGKA